jgi:hypothetical protein
MKLATSIASGITIAAFLTYAGSVFVSSIDILARSLASIF